MTATVLLHLGPHKTATTLIQAAVFESADRLAERGVHVASSGVFRTGHHDLAWGLYEGERRINLSTIGREMATWDLLSAEARRLPDDSKLLVTTENFSMVLPEEIEPVRSALADLEVELVIGFRDPVRLLPSLWQEGVKWGRVRGLEESVPELMTDRRIDLLALVDLWAEATSASDVHVVVVPGSGTVETVANFAAALGVPVEVLGSAAAGRVNASLSWVHTEAIRRVTSSLDPFELQSSLVERQYLAQFLAALPLNGVRNDVPTLSSDSESSAVELRDRLRAEVVERGFVVHGDLGTLPGGSAGRVGQPSDDEVAAAIGALQCLVSDPMVRERLAAAVVRPSSGRGVRGIRAVWRRRSDR